MQSVVADVLAQFERAVPSRNSRIALAGLGLVSSYILLRKVLPTRFLSSKGKAVLVTGCDTPLGFGTAIARRLHQLGYVVFAGCLNAEEAKKTVHADQAGSSTFHVIQLDVTNQAQIDKAVVEVEAWLAANPEFRLFSIVNNAGIGAFSPLEWLQMDTFIKVFEVNCFGIVKVTKAFLPLIRKGGHGGRVVVISSLAGEMPNPGATPYCGSKAAAISIAECLSLELSKFGIKASVVCPDFYRTNIITDVDRHMAALDREVALIPPEIFKAYGGEDRVRRQKKSMTDVLPSVAKTDITPVIDCVIDGISNPSPKRRYYPIDTSSRVAAFLFQNFPGTYDWLSKRVKMI